MTRNWCAVKMEESLTFTPYTGEHGWHTRHITQGNCYFQIGFGISANMREVLHSIKTRCRGKQRRLMKTALFSPEVLTYCVLNILSLKSITSIGLQMRNCHGLRPSTDKLYLLRLSTDSNSNNCWK